MMFNAFLNNYFSYMYIMAVSFIVGGNLSTWRKPPICRKSLSSMHTPRHEHDSNSKVKALVAIGFDCTCRCKSNYHMIMTTFPFPFSMSWMPGCMYNTTDYHDITGSGIKHHNPNHKLTFVLDINSLAYHVIFKS